MNEFEARVEALLIGMYRFVRFSTIPDQGTRRWVLVAYFGPLLLVVALMFVGMHNRQHWTFPLACVISIVPVLLAALGRQIARTNRTPKVVGQPSDLASFLATPHVWVAYASFWLSILKPLPPYRGLVYWMAVGFTLFMIAIGRWGVCTLWYKHVAGVFLIGPTLCLMVMLIIVSQLPEQWALWEIWRGREIAFANAQIVPKGTTCYRDEDDEPDFDGTTTAFGDWNVYVSGLKQKKDRETYFQVYYGGKNREQGNVRVLWVGMSNLKTPSSPPPATRAQAMASGMAPTPSVKVGDTFTLTAGNTYYMDKDALPILDQPKWIQEDRTGTVVKLIVRNGQNYARVKFRNITAPNNFVWPVMYWWVLV